MEFIHSDQNSLVKLARKLLRSARERMKFRKTLLDGVHLIEAYAYRFGLESAQIMASETAQHAPELHRITARWPCSRFAVLPEPLFRSITPVETPSGIVAVVDIPVFDAKHATGENWLMLDGIQDPGNLGSILRTAAATGISRVLLSKTCNDPWSPKCLRGGMGAQFVLPCEQSDLLDAMKVFPGKCIATAPRKGQSLCELDLVGQVALIFGGEGRGLVPELLARADAIAHIPLAGQMESLNVGAAVAVFCFERLRQSLHTSSR